MLNILSITVFKPEIASTTDTATVVRVIQTSDPALGKETFASWTVTVKEFD